MVCVRSGITMIRCQCRWAASRATNSASPRVLTGLGRKQITSIPFGRARTTHLGIASERNHDDRGIPGLRQVESGFHSPLPGVTAESDDCVDARRSIAWGPHKQPGGRNHEDNDRQEHDEDDAFEPSEGEWIDHGAHMAAT